MNCDCYRELWSKYCEAEIDAQSKEELEEHLRSCRICAEGLAAFRRTLESLRDLPRLEVSPSFDARLARAIAEEMLSEQEPWYSRLGALSLRFAPAAASIAAVFVVSLVLALYFAPGEVPAPVADYWQDAGLSQPAGPAATGPSVTDQMQVSLPGRGQVRVEPWSVAGQWPQSLADSTLKNYTMRFVLDKIILEGEEAARASVPEEEAEVRTKYVTF